MLSAPPVGPLQLDTKRSEPEHTREQYLRGLFGRRRDFFHRGRLFTYAPSPTNKESDDVISGFVGKQVEESVQSGPDNLFALTKQKHWKAAFLAIDVRPQEQVIAFEKRADVGSGAAIIESMIEAYTRELREFTWRTDIEYLQRAEDFWAATENNRGLITEVIFDFHPENGLRGFDKFKEFSKLAKAETNGESTSFAIKNADGALYPKGEFVESAAEYATEGGGGIRLKAGRRTLFDSRTSKRKSEVPDVVMPRQGEPSKILGLIGYLFTRRGS